MFQKSIAAAAALAVAGFASAQTGGTGSDNSELVDLSGISVKLSLGIPYDERLRDGIGESLLGVGVEFTPTRSLLRGSETYFAADLFLRGFDTGRGYVLPITINQRFYNTRVIAANVRRSYAFVGIGVAFTDADNSGGTSGALALRGGVGSEIGERLFFEAGLLFGAGDDNARPNLVFLSAGYRF